MVIRLIPALMLMHMVTCLAMDNETTNTTQNETDTTQPESSKKLTPEESRNNKIRFIRDTFTAEETWNYCFAQKMPSILCRDATTRHEIPALPLATQKLMKILLTSVQEKGISFSAPLITYERATVGNFVACKDASVHLISRGKGEVFQHTYYPLCHNQLITGLAMVSPEWLAVAGGNAISFCNMKNRKRHRDWVFSLDKSISISAIQEKYGTLQVSSTADQQYIIYPYDMKLYNSLHGYGLSDWELEIVMKAAFAVHTKGQLQLTLGENDTFKLLPEHLQSLIDHFLIIIDVERQKTSTH